MSEDQDKKCIVKIHIPEDSGGGFITIPATSDMKLVDIKQKFLEKAKAKLGPGKLDDRATVYCLRVKSCNLLCHDESMLLDTVKTVERSNMLEFLLSTWEAERPNHKLLNDRVYFHFAVRKRTSHSSDTNERQIHFDFSERIITNLNKESEKSHYSFESLVSFSKSETDPLYFRTEYKKSSPAECYAQNAQEKGIILDLMKRIIADDCDGITNEYPRSVLHRGYIEKREPKSGNYSRRFVILVPYKLFCFAGPTGVAHPRNVLALQNARISMNGFEFDIELGNGYNFHFRTCSEDEAERKQWSWGLLQASQYTKTPILTKVPSAAPEEATIKRADKQPGSGIRGRVNTIDIQRSVLNMKVFFNFAVLEQEGSSKAEARILHFNIHERILQSVAKEVVKKQISFADVADYAMDDTNSLVVSMTLKNSNVIKYTAQTIEERHIIFALVARVIENDFSGLDANRPRLILKSGFAEKKEKAAVWKKRYMMLLPWKLFCFRDVTGVSYPRNLISLYNANVSKLDDEKIVITLPDGYKFIFRLPSAAQRDEWYIEIQKSIVFDMDTKPSEPAAPSIKEEEEAPQTTVEDFTSPPPPPAEEDTASPTVAAEPSSTNDNNATTAAASNDNTGSDDQKQNGDDEGNKEEPPPAPQHSIDEEAIYAGDESDDEEEEDAPPPPPEDEDHDGDDHDDDHDGEHDDEDAPPTHVNLAQPEVSLFDMEEGEQSHHDGSRGGAAAVNTGGLEETASLSSALSHEQVIPSSTRGGRRKSITTEKGLDTADIPECDLGHTHSAERTAKERAERLKILGYWGISEKKEGWKERERQALESGAKVIPVVKPLI